MKVGVIGTGSMGRNHARVLSELSRLAAVCDSDKQVGEKVADKFGVPFFERVDDMLSSGLDAVSIVTPTATHYDIARRSIEAGVHLLLEKPATGSSERLAELSREAEEAGKVLAVGFIERHNPVVEFAKASLRNGEFGSMITAHARRVSSFPSRIKDVGVMMDLGVHDIDVIKYLVDAPAKSVYAVAGRFMHEKYEDYANVVIEFDSGAVGLVEINWLTPTKVRRLALTCSNRFVELDYVDQSIGVSSSTLTEIDPADLYHLGVEYHTRRINLKKEEPLRRELLDFIGACERKCSPLIDGADAAGTLRIAEAAVESVRDGAAVSLAP